MKKVIIPAVVALVAALAFVMMTSQSEAASKKGKFAASITCDGCKMKIEKGMKDVDGVNSTEVDVETKTVNVDYDPEVITLASLKENVANLGFEVSDVKECSTSDKECSTKDKSECSTKDKADAGSCDTDKKMASKECGSEDNCCKDKALETK
jgi:copper chaperone CopZ